MELSEFIMEWRGVILGAGFLIVYVIRKIQEHKRRVKERDTKYSRTFNAWCKRTDDK